MVHLRAVVPLIVLVLAAAPAASLPSPVPDAQDAAKAQAFVAGMLGHLRMLQGNDTAAAQDVAPAGHMLDLRPLGDIDGDGAADVLARLTLLDPPDGEDAVAGEAQALSGRDLSKVLWSQKLKASEGLASTGDVDGDGVQDLMYTRVGDVTGDSLSAPVPMVYAGVSSATVPLHQEARSGRDNKAFISYEGSVTYESNYVREGLPVPAFVYHSDYALQADILVPAGEKAYMGVQFSYGSGFTYAGSLAGTLYASSSSEAFSMRPLPSGEGQGMEDLEQAVAVYAARLDGKPGNDLLVTLREDAAPASVYVAGVGASLHGFASPYRVEAWGADGSLLWERSLDREVSLGREAVALPIGDVNGDGIDDVELADILFGADGVVERLELLSGKDGSVLLSKEYTDTIFLVLPYGDLDGDGADELLAITGTLDGAAQIGVADAKLEALWLIPLDDGILDVLSFRSDSLADPVGGFADWTGDGSPDIALLLGEGDDEDVAPSLTVKLLHGQDGKAAWSRTLADVYTMHVLDDVTGTGSQDLLVTLAPGVNAEYDELDLSAVPLQGLLVAAESGQDHTVARLRQGMGAPYTTYSARTLGNLDGEGGPEWGIRISDYPANPWGEDIPDDNDPTVRWLVFSGVPGAVPQLVESAGGPGARGNGTDVGTVLNVKAAPDVQDPAPVVEDARDTPALGVAMALVALGAVLRRRRA